MRSSLVLGEVDSGFVVVAALDANLGGTLARDRGGREGFVMAGVVRASRQVRALDLARGFPLLEVAAVELLAGVGAEVRGLALGGVQAVPARQLVVVLQEILLVQVERAEPDVRTTADVLLRVNTLDEVRREGAFLLEWWGNLRI